MLKELGLDRLPSKVNYLNRSDSKVFEGTNDAAAFDKTKTAIYLFGLTDERQRDAFRMLASSWTSQMKSRKSKTREQAK